MESEPIRTPEPIRTFEEPTSMPTLQETLKEFFGQDLNVESSPPLQVSDEDDREGLPEQTFSNVSLTREPVQTKVKKDEQATSKCTFEIFFGGGGGGVAGSEDFACATLLTTSFIFKTKLKIFCHPTLLKIRFKITVTPLQTKRAKSKLWCFNKL